MALLFSAICQIVVGLLGVLAVSGSGLGADGGTSSTRVSKPEGRFDYNIDHSYYGSVYGSAYPHGYGGLGDGSGGYKTGDAHFVGALPQSLALWPSSGGYSGGHGGYGGSHGGYGGLASSYANYNQKSKNGWSSESSGWSGLDGYNSYGYGGGYEAGSQGWH